MWSDRRTIVQGLFAADVIAAVLFTAFAYSTDTTGQDLSYLPMLLLVGVAYSLIAILVFVVPLLMVFGRLRVTSLALALALALVAGFFIGAVMAGFTEWPRNGLMEVIRVNLGDHAVRRVWVFAAIGCASAFGFWLVVKDRSQAELG